MLGQCTREVVGFQSPEIFKSQLDEDLSTLLIGSTSSWGLNQKTSEVPSHISYFVFASLVIRRSVIALEVFTGICIKLFCRSFLLLFLCSCTVREGRLGM